MNIAALLPPLLLSHLRVVLTHGHQVIAVRHWDGLHDALRRSAIDAVVLDPMADGVVRLADILALRDRHPTLPIIVYTTLQPVVMRATVELGRNGIEHMVLHRFDDEPRRFLDLIERLPGYALADTLVEHLRPHLRRLPMVLSRTVEKMFRAPARFHGVPDLAQAAGMTIRMVYRRFTEGSLSSPRQMIQAARVLRAYAYLRTDGTLLVDVAERLGYSSHRILTQQMQDMVGMTPTVVRTALSPEEFINRLLARLLAGDTVTAAIDESLEDGVAE